MTGIPVTVIVATKNEAGRIGHCLAALGAFDEIIVVDSGSADGTKAIAAAAGARVEPFQWNGAYPKKRQWCLDTLNMKHDWIFFVDADEIVGQSLADEISALFADGPPACQGYFVRGLYRIGGRVLTHGLANAKLALFDRRRLCFPAVNDLGLPGMGEMEGHYQPVFRPGEPGRIGRLKEGLIHDAYGTGEAWTSRHLRYAAWEAGMNARRAWPADPVPWRQALKTLFRAMPFRPLAAFCHCYIWRRGFLDGRAGFRLAADRWRYYAMVSDAAGQALRTPGKNLKPGA